MSGLILKDLVGLFDSSGALKGYVDKDGNEQSLDAPAIQALVSGGGNLVLGVLGQSNERGQVDIGETISGVASRTVYPQACRSLKNPAFRAPIFPSVSYSGGFLFRVYDDMLAAGWVPHIINGAVGSLSMVRDACGQVQSRANSTTYRQRREPETHGDAGHAGDLMIVQGRLFLCIVGVKSFYTIDSNAVYYGGGGEIDFQRNVGTATTAASEPAAFATASVGDIIVDGTVSWQCLSTTTTYGGRTYTAGGVLTENMYGFDPYGLCHRLRRMMQEVPSAKARCVLIQNGQSDTGNATYQSALENIGSYFLKRGIKVAIGLTCYQPSAGTAAYDNLSTRVAAALTTLRNGAGVYYDAADVITGANLYSAMGSTGPMASGGAYFVKDYNMDNIHLNSPGAIAAGGFVAAALIAGLAPFA